MADDWAVDFDKKGQLEEIVARQGGRLTEELDLNIIDSALDMGLLNFNQPYFSPGFFRNLSSLLPISLRSVQIKARYPCFSSALKTAKGNLTSGSGLTEHASKRRTAQKGCSQRVSAAQQASEQESAQAEDPPPRQPQGRQPAILGDRGQTKVTSTPIRLRSTKHQPPVRQPIALTGNALLDWTNNPCMAKAPPALVQEQPVSETGSSCNDVRVSQAARTLFSKLLNAFRKVLTFPQKGAFQAYYPGKAQQREMVRQSEGTCEPLLATAPTSNSNEAIITAPHATTPPSSTQQGANRQVPLDRDTLATHTDGTGENAQFQQQRADGNTFVLHLHQLPGVQRLSAATKVEPDVVHWKQFSSALRQQLHAGRHCQNVAGPKCFGSTATTAH
ncbi:hypothetical protein Efla_004031 [Eimeria flavescens]